MLEVVNVNSKEFQEINEAIGRQLQKNAEIQEKVARLDGSAKKQKQNKDKQDAIKKEERTQKRIKALREQTANIENRSPYRVQDPQKTPPQAPVLQINRHYC